MAETKWIESAGGPLVVLPKCKRAKWEGVASGDYEEACGVRDYLGVLRREWGVVLVLGDEPLRTAVIRRPEGPAIIRWLYAPTADRLLSLALDTRLDDIEPAETLSAELLNEAYVIFDGGAAGQDAELLEFHPVPNVRIIRTYVVKDDANEVGMVLHSFMS